MSSPFIIINEIEELLNDINSGLTSTLSSIKTSTDRLTSTRATYIDNINTATTINNTASGTGTLSQKLSWIGNTLIGATGNTGGSASAGTVMAKLNAIVTNTAGNNTGSSTGTLSQKLTDIKSALGTTNNYARGYTVTPSSTNLKTLATSGTTELIKDNLYTNNTQNGTTYTVYIQHPGVYRIYVTGTTTITDMGNSGVKSNSNDSAKQAWGLKVYCDVFSLAQEQVQKTITFGTGIIANVASTTKTYDIYAEAGDRIQIRMRLQSNYSTSNCGTFGVVGKFDVSDVSIRGTTNIIDASVV